MRVYRIQSLLKENLSPYHLEVFNESHLHSVPEGSETHIKVVLVSDSFTGVSRVKRQQDVMQLLKSEFALGLHALSMQLLTVSEWINQKGKIIASPECSKK